MTYEIEIKSLLGTSEEADHFRDTILQKGARKTSESSQLNHYFLLGDFTKLLLSLKKVFGNEQFDRLVLILEKGQKHSIRTRQADGIVKFVVKASVDETTSDNGIARMEFEEPVKITLDELDALLLDAGFEYQAKWSRDREEYRLENITICLDKNAGYGWLTEFELVLEKDEDRHLAEKSIRDLMKGCGVGELSQDRLARMFEYYNKNWRDYYGTNNIFNLQ